MDTPVWMDWLTGGIAAVILISGLAMLLSGVSAMNQKK